MNTEYKIQEVQQYYNILLHKNRLIPIYNKDNELIMVITFYILDSDDQYLNSTDWVVIQEDPCGTICFIDHLFSKNSMENQYKIAFKIFSMIIKILQEDFPLVQYVRWCRYKDGRRYIFSKSIRRSENVIRT